MLANFFQKISKNFFESGSPFHLKRKGSESYVKKPIEKNLVKEIPSEAKTQNAVSKRHSGGGVIVRKRPGRIEVFVGQKEVHGAHFGKNKGI